MRIKTAQNYRDLTVDAIVDHELDVKLNWATGTKQWMLDTGNGIFAIRELTYTNGKNQNQDLEVDFERGILKRIKNSASKTKNNIAANNTNSEFDPDSIYIETTRLKDINFDPKLFQPIKTGTYLDEFVSYKGGFMPGINIMLTGDPGVGKSSNLMDILVNVKEHDSSKRVLYISAEMDECDVKEFEQYYPGLGEIDFFYMAKYVTDPNNTIAPYKALLSVLNQGWDMVVMDSIVEVQSMIQEDLALPQKKAEKWMLDLMKTHNSGFNKTNLYTTFLCIQQKNKGGTYVGSKRLEHMTSAFLELCWDPKEKGKRYMIFEKNRKGKEKVKLYYNFAKDGGIVYDEIRHSKELQILERLQTPSDITISEFTESDFKSLWSEFNESIS